MSRRCRRVRSRHGQQCQVRQLSSAAYVTKQEPFRSYLYVNETVNHTHKPEIVQFFTDMELRRSFLATICGAFRKGPGSDGLVAADYDFFSGDQHRWSAIRDGGPEGFSAGLVFSAERTVFVQYSAFESETAD